MANERIPILRILDANANRASEGLRVVEEYLRFVLEDRHLAGVCKQMRHDLQLVVDQIPTAQRSAARETQTDVGTTIQVETEYARESARAVARASQKRVEQAFRCLEEYSKPVLPHLAETLEKLRYRAYTLGRAIEITVDSCQRLERARFYVLMDARGPQNDFADFAKLLIRGGVSIIQLRDKSLGDRELLARARELRALTRNSETLFIMNDRPDLARLSGADGVHVGQEEVTVKEARTIVGPDAIVGVSTHSLVQSRQAVLDGANYIGCGPTFRSTTKEFSSYAGLEFLAEVAAEIALPAFAIGGITLSNLPQVLATGMQRVAIQGSITNAANPAQTIEQFKAGLGNHRGTEDTESTKTTGFPKNT